MQHGFICVQEAKTYTERVQLDIHIGQVICVLSGRVNYNNHLVSTGGRIVVTRDGHLDVLEPTSLVYIEKDNVDQIEKTLIQGIVDSTIGYVNDVKEKLI